MRFSECGRSALLLASAFLMVLQAGPACLAGDSGDGSPPAMPAPGKTVLKAVIFQPNTNYPDDPVIIWKDPGRNQRAFLLPPGTEVDVLEKLDGDRYGTEHIVCLIMTADGRKGWVPEKWLKIVVTVAAPKRRGSASRASVFQPNTLYPNDVVIVWKDKERTERAFLLEPGTSVEVVQRALDDSGVKMCSLRTQDGMEGWLPETYLKPQPPGLEEETRIAQRNTKLVLLLGALDEKYWKPAMDELATFGETAIPELNAGLGHTLQIVRARCCSLMSRIRKGEDMIEGFSNALKAFPGDTADCEADIRRWAARSLAEFHPPSAEECLRVSMAIDRDQLVRLWCGFGLLQLGIRDGAAVLIESLKSADPKILGLAAALISDSLPSFGLRGDFLILSEDDRKLEAERLALLAARGEFEVHPRPRDLEPHPVDVEVFRWSPPAEPVDDEARREIELSLQDAEKALSDGNLRAATAAFGQAFRWGGMRDFAVVLRQHECWRRLGPDNAEKSAAYLLEKIIPMNPHDPKLWIAAAESALASGGEAGRARADQALRMALVLDPDDEKAKSLLAGIGK